MTAAPEQVDALRRLGELLGAEVAAVHRRDPHAGAPRGMPPATDGCGRPLPRSFVIRLASGRALLLAVPDVRRPSRLARLGIRCRPRDLCRCLHQAAEEAPVTAGRPR